MANPSSWTFRRGAKWHSGWRDETGRCRSKAHPAGAGKSLAQEFARKMAIEASQIRAGQSVGAKEINVALEAFLTRHDVKPSTHALNRRHLIAFLEHFRIRFVDHITHNQVNSWLGHLQGLGWNEGGQSLSLRVLRTFCRFCHQKKWIVTYPFLDFKIPKSQFVGRYLSNDERTKLLSINPRYAVDVELNRALTFGLYSLLRISQVFNADWQHFKAPDQLWVPGIKGQDGRWIALHPKALEVMGTAQDSGQIFSYWPTLAAFRESVLKKVRREKLHGVRFHDTKHTGISALLENGYSVPEVCRISGNSYRTIAHYAHVNEQKVFEKWKAFEYSGATASVPENRTATVQQEAAKQGAKEAPKVAERLESENTNSSTSRPVFSA